MTHDLWAEAPLLQRRLSERTIAAQEHNQVLPSSLDAEHVQRELGPGVTVQTGWGWGGRTCARSCQPTSW